LIFYRWTDGAASAAEVDAWTGYDNSLRIVREVLSPPRGDESSFYGYLAANTNIPASVRVAPVDISLADLDRSPSSVRPHVFVIVVDSLRRDYLSPYNESVSFTPAIQEFARDSVLFENAFTRYGGTGLSEPSIWTGAMLLHKQYITPFRPMNTLQKLLRAEGYQLYVSRDSILRIVLEPAVTDVDLDPPESTMNYDLARTFAILEERIRQRAPSAAPIFVYTQPQNPHVSVIRREGGGCGECGSSYEVFYAPYAYRVRAVDQAFGQFISFLRTRGLYENSIIILTADHGDSLGEEGRWGHAYTLFPEIVRVPLIMHLPARMREDFSTDPRRPAFLTDIAPTLYSLLGFKTPPDDGIHGAPLFAPGSAAPPPRSAPYLLASSYGAVYGLLSNNAAELFVADAVNRRTYMFNLRARQPVSRPLHISDRNAREKVIREAVAAIARFYRFTEPGERK
jgi:arylsulfatase A-like enzyme